jgi:hypothetical protein
MASGVDFCGSKSDNGSNSAPTNSAPKMEEIAPDDDLPF